MLKRLWIMSAVCLLMMLGAGCAGFKASNASACVIPFDYGDGGVNDQNAKALLMYYCLCKDEHACR